MKAIENIYFCLWSKLVLPKGFLVRNNSLESLDTPLHDTFSMSFLSLQVRFLCYNYLRNQNKIVIFRNFRLSL